MHKKELYITPYTESGNSPCERGTMQESINQLLTIVNLLSALLNGGTYEIPKVEIVQNTALAVVSSSIPEVPDILKRIAECESGGRQFKDDGSVVRGIANPQDIGKYQINLYWNGAKAKELGYDLFTEEGNTLMALYLYHSRGTKDWSWSAGCWNK